MVREIKVTHKKVGAGKYEVWVNEKNVGLVFKEWQEGGRYRWSHSKVSDKEIVDGKSTWSARRDATISLLIEHFFDKDSDHKRMLRDLYVG